MAEFLEYWLPVVIMTGMIYLIKIGFFSGILLLVKKLWDRLRKKEK